MNRCVYGIIKKNKNVNIINYYYHLRCNKIVQLTLWHVWYKGSRLKATTILNLIRNKSNFALDDTFWLSI